MDLDVALTVLAQEKKDLLKAAEWRDGGLVRHFERHHERRYRLSNRGGSDRRVYLVLEIVSNARVEGADGVDYDDAVASPLAVFDSARGQTSERKLELVEALERHDQVDALTSEELVDASNVEDLPAATRAAFARAATHAETIEGITQSTEANEARKKEVETDLERVRGHVAALGNTGTPVATNPLVTRLVALEDRLSALRAENDVLDRRKVSELDAVRAELEGLTSPES
jgi:hypothetical protein